MTRIDKFISRNYGSQHTGDPYFLSNDYFTLVGIFFHFWGYIDLHVDKQQVPTGTKPTFENKLKGVPELEK